MPYDLQLIREQFSLSVLTSTDQCFETTLTEKHPSALLDIAARYSQGRLLHYAFQELKNATLVSSYIFRQLDDRLLLKVMKGLATDLILFGTVFGLLL